MNETTPIEEIKIENLLSAFLKGEARQWDYNRADTVGASEVFTCIRKIWYSKFEIPVDPGFEQTRGAMHRGVTIEGRYFVPALQAQLPKGLKLYRAGDEQQTLMIGRLSCTPDGVIVNEGNMPVVIDGIQLNPFEAIAIDCKSIDPRAKINLSEAKQEHWGQVNVQIGMLKREGTFKVIAGILYYVDASFWDEVSAFRVQYDERVYKRAVERAAQVYGSDNDMALMAEGKIAGGKECEYCPWFERCSQTQVDRIPNRPPQGEKKPSKVFLPPEQEAALRAAVAEAEGHKAQLEELERTVAISRERVKSLLRDLGVRAYKGSGFSVSWSQVAGRKSLDKAAMAAAGIDITQFEVPGQPGDRLVCRSDGALD